MEDQVLASVPPVLDSVTLAGLQFRGNICQGRSTAVHIASAPPRLTVMSSSLHRRTQTSQASVSPITATADGCEWAILGSEKDVRQIPMPTRNCSALRFVYDQI